MENKPIDSKGTTPVEARQMLKDLCDSGFASNVEKLAVALGRNEAEIKSILDGEGKIDEDLLMKIRAISQERNLEID